MLHPLLNTGSVLPVFSAQQASHIYQYEINNDGDIAKQPSKTSCKTL